VPTSRISRLFCSALAASLVLPRLVLADAAPPAGKAFAAPGAAASLPTSGAGGIGQVTLALLLVLAAVFAAAWLMRRLRGLTTGGPQGIEIVSQVTLGARERAVIVKVGATQLLLGVAQGQVSLLHVLPEGTLPQAPAEPGDAAQKPNFAALLKKSLGR
jgi:flagellar protein FliO/FliZ